jgi:hypothetical protein
MGFFLLFLGPSMAVDSCVGLRLRNTILSFAATSSFAYLLVLSSVFSVVKRSMLK